jgi:hypothetical protein
MLPCHIAGRIDAHRNFRALVIALPDGGSNKILEKMNA